MLWLLVTATPAPTPPASSVPDDAVTPGVWGFVITALVGLAVILIILDMVRRLRRLNYRAEIRERLEAEAAADEAAAGEQPAGPRSPSSAAGDTAARPGAVPPR